MVFYALTINYSVLLFFISRVRARLDVIKQQKPVSGHKVVSWRRHSMRKTRPIVLPKPADNVHATPTRSPRSVGDQEPLNGLVATLSQPNENAPSNSSCTLTRASSHDSLSHELSTTNDIDDDHEYTNISTMRSRSQFRNAIPQLSAGPQSLQTDEMILAVAAASNGAAHLCVNLEYDDDGDARPRQLGRRAEPRNRIVSITTERSSEGDQVSKIGLCDFIFVWHVEMRSEYVSIFLLCSELSSVVMVMIMC